MLHTKKVASFMIFFFIALSFTISPVIHASSDIENKCQYEVELAENPDNQTINCLLTETAFKHDVPPEIVKAIAEEESDWRQFDENGEPLVSADNGIGIMQITNHSQYDDQLLKNDIVYNIEAGVEILSQMFERNDLPTINNGDRNIIENWYFAIMAYNGTKPVNSPIFKNSGERNTDAYQEKIFRNIEEFGFIELENIPFSTGDFEYDTNSDENIKFITMNYYFNLPFTSTKHQFIEGQKVGVTTDVRIRELPTTSSRALDTLTKGEIITIDGSIEFDRNINSQNHFVWYPVKRADGSTGYVASSYLAYRYKDVPAGHYAEEEIYYLTDRGILYGVGNDKFGMGQDLTRWQAVLLIARANNISLANRPDPEFMDVPKDYPHYAEIAAAVDEGLFSGVSAKEFKPNATLTRREMVVVLQNLFQFPEATSTHPFVDIDADWYADEVAILYEAGVVAGLSENKFGPLEKVTREQFASFMVRAMDEEFRIK